MDDFASAKKIKRIMEQEEETGGSKKRNRKRDEIESNAYVSRSRETKIVF